MSACVEERPWLNRVRCGVVERGGVLEHELLGVPPMGATLDVDLAGRFMWMECDEGLCGVWSVLEGRFFRPPSYW